MTHHITRSCFVQDAFCATLKQNPRGMDPRAVSVAGRWPIDILRPCRSKNDVMTYRFTLPLPLSIAFIMGRPTQFNCTVPCCCCPRMTDACVCTFRLYSPHCTAFGSPQYHPHSITTRANGLPGLMTFFKKLTDTLKKFAETWKYNLPLCIFSPLHLYYPTVHFLPSHTRYNMIKPYPLNLNHTYNHTYTRIQNGKLTTEQTHQDGKF